MIDEIALPIEFGGSWAAFCRDWCRNGDLAYCPAEVSRGLSALKRLWPEKIDRILPELAFIIGDSTRCTEPIVPAIDTGLLLEACKNARYFRELLDKLKSVRRSDVDRRATYSELVLVASLRRLGYDAQCEALLKGSPDAQCVTDGTVISFEVYSPGQSYDSQRQRDLVTELQIAVRRELSKSRVEIGILDSFVQDDIASAVEVIRSAAPATWTHVEDWARIRRVDYGQDLPPVFDDDRRGLSITIGQVVRWEESDKRAQAALEKKRGQISGGVANVVVINVCEVGGVGGDWPEVTANLSGSDFEKVGAIAFFDQCIKGSPEAVCRRWRVVVNSKAQVRIPEILIGGIESLDQSSLLGLVPKPRLFMG